MLRCLNPCHLFLGTFSQFDQQLKWAENLHLTDNSLTGFFAISLLTLYLIYSTTPGIGRGVTEIEKEITEIEKETDIVETETREIETGIEPIGQIETTEIGKFPSMFKYYDDQ